MEEAGQTVECFLRKKGYSNKLLVHLRKTPMGISIADSLIYTTHLLAPGELLRICILEESSSEHIVPVPMALNIIYEDEDILVVDKPAGLPIHPSQGNYDNTLANGLAWYFTERGETFVYRAINRLDRDTTGLLIIAKHMLSACILSRLVKERLIHREYLAVTCGLLPEKGTITAPIARVLGSTIERCVDFANGETACTHYARIGYNPDADCSLASIVLDTGRTHQIRVHMKHIGHPLPGDFLYHPDYRFVTRQALHSHRLTFSHPITGAAMEFVSGLPADWEVLMEDMKLAWSAGETGM